MAFPKHIRLMHIADKLSMDGLNPNSCAILLNNWITHTDPKQFSITVCSLKALDPGGKFLEEKGISVYYLGQGKYSPKNIDAICNLIEAEKIDLVHLHGYSAGNFGRIAARKKGILNIVHEHAVLKIRPHQYIVDFLLRKHTDAAVTVSQAVKEFVIRGRNIPSHKIHVIGNGIKLEAFKKCGATENQNLRSALKIPENRRIVGTVTRLRSEKGVAVFIEAMPKIIAAFPDVFFLIVGDGPLRSQLEHLAEGLGLSKHLKFLGFRSDILALLSIFDIHVLSSLMEGFCLSLVEAMAVGNAIVASKVGGMREILEDEKTGLFVPPNNVEALSEKVLFLLENTNEASRLSQSAVRSSRKFCIQSSTDSLNQLYQQVLEKAT